MLWGRGAVDMKNMDAMMIGALQDILGSGRRPARDLVVAFFADEENGGVFGSHWVVDNHPELFEGATEAISEVGGSRCTSTELAHTSCRPARRPWSGSSSSPAGAPPTVRVSLHENAVTRLAEAVAAARPAQLARPAHEHDLAAPR